LPPGSYGKTPADVKRINARTCKKIRFYFGVSEDKAGKEEENATLLVVG